MQRCMRARRRLLHRRRRRLLPCRRRFHRRCPRRLRRHRRRRCRLPFHHRFLRRCHHPFRLPFHRQCRLPFHFLLLRRRRHRRERDTPRDTFEATRSRDRRSRIERFARSSFAACTSYSRRSRSSVPIFGGRTILRRRCWRSLRSCSATRWRRRSIRSSTPSREEREPSITWPRPRPKIACRMQEHLSCRKFEPNLWGFSHSGWISSKPLWIISA